MTVDKRQLVNTGCASSASAPEFDSRSGDEFEHLFLIRVFLNVHDTK